MAMAIVLCILIKILFLYMSVYSQNNEVEYYFYQAVAMFLYGYLIYGPLVLLQCKMGLITITHDN